MAGFEGYADARGRVASMPWRYGSPADYGQIRARSARDQLAEALVAREEPAQAGQGERSPTLQIEQQRMVGGPTGARHGMGPQELSQIAAAFLGRSGGSTIETVALNARGALARYRQAGAARAEKEARAAQMRSAAEAIRRHTGPDGQIDFSALAADPNITPEMQQMLIERQIGSKAATTWTLISDPERGDYLQSSTGDLKKVPWAAGGDDGVNGQEKKYYDKELGKWVYDVFDPASGTYKPAYNPDGSRRLGDLTAEESFLLKLLGANSASSPGGGLVAPVPPDQVP